MRFDFKKNEKLTRVITIVLIGLLLLIAIMPSKNKKTMETEKRESKIEIENESKDYEERLKSILESSYGKGTMEVMINLAAEKRSYDFMGNSDSNYRVDGVIVVAHVKDKNAVADISYAVCALFDLPVHKVAVIVR